MKTQTLTTLLALLATTLLLANCKGEPSCPDASERTQYLLESVKLRLPYTGFDTLYFLTNTNDTIECIGLGRLIFFEANYVRDPNPDCNVFKTIKHEGYRDNYQDLLLEVSQKPPILNNDLWIPRYNISWLTINFRFNIGLVGAPYADTTDGNYKFHESINVLGFDYKSVSEISYEKNTIYINKMDGIIRLYNASDNTTWNKIKTN